MLSWPAVKGGKRRGGKMEEGAGGAGGGGGHFSPGGGGNRLREGGESKKGIGELVTPPGPERERLLSFPFSLSSTSRERRRSGQKRGCWQGGISRWKKKGWP